MTATTLTIGEGATHAFAVTPPYDTSSATLTAQYVAYDDNNVVAGDEQSGATAGTEITFATDTQAIGLSPGLYRIEVRVDTGDGTPYVEALSPALRLRIEDAASV